MQATELLTVGHKHTSGVLTIYNEKNRKFWVENQMVRSIPFGTFRKKWAVV